MRYADDVSSLSPPPDRSCRRPAADRDRNSRSWVAFAGRLLRRNLPHRVKAAPYECGEQPSAKLGAIRLALYVAAWFRNLRSRIGLLWPWAVVYNEAGRGAALRGLPFFLGVSAAVGFVYFWALRLF